jgi:hypothetical protein
MRIVGLVFAGTSTEHRSEMVRFVRETLGLEQVRIGGVEADVFGPENDLQRYIHFRAPDGKLYELIEQRGTGATPRSR